MRFGSITAGNMAEAARAAVSGRFPVGTWIRIPGRPSVRFAGIGRRGAPVLVSGRDASPRVFRAIVRAVRADRLAETPRPAPVAAVFASPTVSPLRRAGAVLAAVLAPVAASSGAVLAAAVVSASPAADQLAAAVSGATADQLAAAAAGAAVLAAGAAILSRLSPSRGGIRFPRILPRDAAVTVPALSGNQPESPPCRSIPPPGNGPPPPGRVAPRGAMSGTSKPRS
jgi:hypothetical protein